MTYFVHFSVFRTNQLATRHCQAAVTHCA